MIPHRQQQGFSLIELMIALVLGLVVTAAVIEIFLGARQVYQVQEAKARIQENGRFAMRTVTNSLLEAGYFGCATRSGVEITNTLNATNNYLWDFETPIEGKEATSDSAWAPAIDAAITQPLGGSDILTVRTISEPSIQVTQHPGGTPPGSANIQVNAGNGLEQFDIVMVTDCLDAAVFQITSANPDTSGSLVHNTGNGTPGNATKALSKNYEGGWINKIQTKSLYIRNNSRGIPALYQRLNNNNAEELVDGIESMQIRYGVDDDADGSADRYQTADAVSNWANVLSVEIELLLASTRENLTVDGPQTYFFNGNNITASDSRLRSVFSRTVTLRNRVP